MNSGNQNIIQFYIRFIGCLTLAVTTAAVYCWSGFQLSVRNHSAFALVLNLLRSTIGLENSRHFFNQWEAQLKPISTCSHFFSRACRRLRVFASNSDWFDVLFACVLLARVITLVVVVRLSTETRSISSWTTDHYKSHKFGTASAITLW